jgi:hypothetical protein
MKIKDFLFHIHISLLKALFIYAYSPLVYTSDRHIITIRSLKKLWHSKESELL